MEAPGQGRGEGAAARGKQIQGGDVRRLQAESAAAFILQDRDGCGTRGEMRSSTEGHPG